VENSPRLLEAELATCGHAVGVGAGLGWRPAAVRPVLHVARRGRDEGGAPSGGTWWRCWGASRVDTHDRRLGECRGHSV
jgi:hypothetical protein